MYAVRSVYCSSLPSSKLFIEQVFAFGHTIVRPLGAHNQNHGEIGGDRFPRQ